MTWTFERRLLAAALLAWAAIAVMNLTAGPPLGHDEAAFSVYARGDAQWGYRSRGTVLLAQLGLALGGADWQMRLASAVLGLGLVVAVYAIGRVVFDARSGAWSAAVLAGAHPMVTRNAELLSDLPSAAALIAGFAVMIRELDRPTGPRWRFVLIAPAFAAAFYLRYGSAPVIALAGITAVVLWWRAILARPLPVIAAVLLFAALFIPHIQLSYRFTAKPLGLLIGSSEVPRRAYVGEGLVSYLTSNPFAYYGALVTPVILAALVGVVRRFRTRRAWAIAIIALGQLVALGLQSHAQPRYVFLAVALLIVLGVETWRGVDRFGTTPALVLVGLAWLGVAIVTLPLDRRITQARTSLTASAAAIRAHHGDQRCVLISGVVPQLMWYANCDGEPVQLNYPNTLAPGRARYMVSTPYGRIDPAQFAAARHVKLTELPTGHPDAHVWIISDP